MKNDKAVIPLGPKSGWKDHGELRYTLRALEKYTDVTELMILGTKPSWITNAIFVPWKEVHKRNKDANLIDKVKHASSIWETFIRLSDDHILVKPYVDVPYYTEKVTTKKNGRWFQRLYNTQDLLKKKDFYNYDAHIPVTVNGKLFIEAVESVDYAKEPGCCINSLYFNHIDQNPIKIPKGFTITPEKVEEIKEDTYSLNVKDKCLTDEFKKWLEKKFPTKSKFEK